MQGRNSAKKSGGRGSCRRRWLANLLLIGMVMFSGCSKSGPSNQISPTAFDAAPADIKQLWSDAMGAWKSRHYPEAAKNLASLYARSSSLSTQQADELTRAIEEFGQQAYVAADKGDAGATQAVLILKGATGRRAGSAQ